MRSRAEILLKWTAAVTAVLTLGAVGLAMTGTARAAWPALGLLYATGVSYGLAEMTRLYERHRRRCRECLEGTGPHLRWWALRILLVLTVSTLPVLLLLPALSGPAP
ncbi:MAG: hypothetical protein GWM90_19275 [Gemmatimonadetes bacterium]|nr:hypothetical protein [Gemmatimonadota bacterium]NIQ56549.1 hypothetical protein [Gemmatimonadota bacterium]NIU76752.1 hypothetical protein [Gammaproteobacteria bacterium]NIX46150.1 hypothetical protein [Gemmatimonadota bacterium]NIY10476.1 hypothetical protein [Gemmatimonadota bacterium]